MSLYPKILKNSYLLTDTGVLRSNVRSVLESLSPGAEIIPVLKADAYGMGLVPVAEVLAPLPGVAMLAVAHASEGIMLHQAGIRKETLLLGNPLPQALGSAAEAGLTFTLGRPGLAEALAREARRLGRPLRVQLKLDTGLHRAGVSVGGELAAVLEELRAAGEQLELTGVYSHFADTADAERCKAQFEDYLRGLDQVEAGGFEIGMRHICDSAASENYPEYHLDAVRLGRRLMMDHPTHPLGTVREAASWRTAVTAVHPRSAGDTLGYADAYTMPRDGMVAIIGVGYADGLPPALVQRHASVLIRGRRCPLLACCMDQSLVDVTEVADCAPGEEVTILGYDGAGNFLSAQEAAALYGGIEGCEMIACLTPRVARIYK